MLRKFLVAAVAVYIFAGVVSAQCCGQDDAKKDAAHGRGYIPPSKAVQAERSAVMRAVHDSRMAYLPRQTDPTFDIVSKGWASDIDDQGSCGSCWLVSAKVNIESAYIKAGYGANWRFSNQYLMDCGPNRDPCGGGDEYDVFSVAKSDGLVTEADYGVAYQARKGTCRYKPAMKKWKIGDFLYVDPVQQSGRSSVQSIKNGMVAMGMVSIALDASRFNNYTSGVITTGTGIDHAVNAVGWDDGKQALAEKKTPMDLPIAVGAAGAFKVQNQWGKGWGLGGYLWVSYSSYLVEGMVCTVAPLPPPPPPPDPTPVPPTPIPPIPPPLPGFGTVIIQQPNMADQIFKFNVANSGPGVITADQLKALQDEVKKLQDMLTVKQGGAGCAKLQEQVDAIKKELDDYKTINNDNLRDLLGEVIRNRKAIEALNKGAAPPKEPEAVKPPTKTKPAPTSSWQEGSVEVIVRLPPSLKDAVVYMDGAPTISHGAVRTFITDPLPTSERYVFDIAAVTANRHVYRRVAFTKNQTVVADFTK